MKEGKRKLSDVELLSKFPLIVKLNERVQTSVRRE